MVLAVSPVRRPPPSSESASTQARNRFSMINSLVGTVPFATEGGPLSRSRTRAMMASFSADKGFFAREPALAEARFDLPVFGRLSAGSLGGGPGGGVKETLAVSAVVDLSGEFGCAFMQWMRCGFGHRRDEFHESRASRGLRWGFAELIPPAEKKRTTHARERVQYGIRLHTINT